MVRVGERARSNLYANEAGRVKLTKIAFRVALNLYLNATIDLCPGTITTCLEGRSRRWNHDDCGAAGEL